MSRGLFLVLLIIALIALAAVGMFFKPLLLVLLIGVLIGVVLRPKQAAEGS